MREAFFPARRGALRCRTGPAGRPPADPGHHGQAHDGPRGRVLSWRAGGAPVAQAFFVVRASDQPVAGFYCLLDAATVSLGRGDILRHDPGDATRFVAGSASSIRCSARQTALFVRRWLGRLDMASGRPPVQAACWLDIKRHYLERRPMAAPRLHWRLHELGSLCRRWPERTGVQAVARNPCRFGKSDHARRGPRHGTGIGGWLASSVGGGRTWDLEAATGLLDRSRRGRCTWMASLVSTHTPRVRRDGVSGRARGRCRWRGTV